MKFKKDDLIGLIYGHERDISLIAIYSDIGFRKDGNNRKIVFKYGNKFYQSFYEEACDMSPYDLDDDLIDCDEVFPQEKVIIEYVRRRK